MARRPKDPVNDAHPLPPNFGPDDILYPHTIGPQDATAEQAQAFEQGTGGAQVHSPMPAAQAVDLGRVISRAVGLKANEKLVLHTLLSFQTTYHMPPTQTEIAEAAALPPASVRTILRRLRALGVVRDGAQMPELHRYGGGRALAIDRDVLDRLATAKWGPWWGAK